MEDVNYEEAYKKNKKRARHIHKRVVETKDNQRIYHELMGSQDVEPKDA